MLFILNISFRALYGTLGGGLFRFSYSIFFLLPDSGDWQTHLRLGCGGKPQSQANYAIACGQIK